MAVFYWVTVMGVTIRLKEKEGIRVAIDRGLLFQIERGGLNDPKK